MPILPIGEPVTDWMVKVNVRVEQAVREEHFLWLLFLEFWKVSGLPVGLYHLNK